MNEVGTKRGSEGGTEKPEGDEIGGYQGSLWEGRGGYREGV